MDEGEDGVNCLDHGTLSKEWPGQVCSPECSKDGGGKDVSLCKSDVLLCPWGSVTRAPTS
jgi:hypothetical protein